MAAISAPPMFHQQPLGPVHSTASMTSAGNATTGANPAPSPSRPIGPAAAPDPDPDPAGNPAPAMAFLPPEGEGMSVLGATAANGPTTVAGVVEGAGVWEAPVGWVVGGGGGSSGGGGLHLVPAGASPIGFGPYGVAVAGVAADPAPGAIGGTPPALHDGSDVEVDDTLAAEDATTDENLQPEDDWMSINSDSGVGDVMSFISSTTSLASSVRRAMLEENGRLYHGYNGAKYVLPNDEQERERQRFQYDLCMKTFNGALHFAPISNVHRVLDIGTGLGMWPIQFGDIHLESDVLGVDIIPEQPTLVPPNVHFELANLEEPWTFPYRFDYIHSCMMTGAFEDWPRFYEQAFDYLNPGGWVEIQDIDFPIKCDDGSIPYDSAVLRWSRLMMEAAAQRGAPLDTCGRAGEMMSAAGFVSIERRRFVWPINHWPDDEWLKDLGDHVCVNFINEHHLEGICLALFTRYLGWTTQQLLPFLWNVKRDFLNINYHGYFDIWVTYGRKP